ncbi:hypothetical protein HC928_00535 [bacterium]|nr:hypothetical protein [bacterium]
MCGGKGGSAPAPVDPMREAEAQMALAAQQAELARQAEEQRRIAEEAERVRVQQQRDADLSAAFSGALNSANMRASDLGLSDFDPNRYLDPIRSSIPSTATSFDQYFGPSAIDNMFNQHQQSLRTQYENQLRSQLPYGFESTHFPDTADDPYIDAILNEQYGDALTSLTGAREQGLLSRFGFDDATRRLDTQKTGAQSQLQTLGGGVLSGYRGALSDIGNTAYGQARNFNLGQQFDPDYYAKQVQDKASSFSSNLEGDLRSAVGGTPLFDINSIIGKSSANTSVNPTQQKAQTGSPLLNALEQRVNEPNRSVSQQGVF